MCTWKQNRKLLNWQRLLQHPYDHLVGLLLVAIVEDNASYNYQLGSGIATRGSADRQSTDAAFAASDDDDAVMDH